MPITITIPGGGLNVGPGYVVHLQSDFIGPLPTGSVWRTTITTDAEPGGDNIVFTQTDAFGATASFLVAAAVGATSDVGSQQPSGQVQVNVFVDLVEGGTGNLLDTGSERGLTWQPTAMLWQQVKTQHFGTGLTVQQADELHETWTNVQRDLQLITGAVLSTGIGSVLAHPDANLMDLTTPAFFISGSGVLTGLPSTGLRGLYGIRWSVSEHPPGAGINEGSVSEWELRVVQFAPQYTLAATGEFVTPEVLDSRLDTFYWLWQRAFPARILYTVSPGFVLRCQYIGFFG